MAWKFDWPRRADLKDPGMQYKMEWQELCQLILALEMHSSKSSRRRVGGHFTLASLQLCLVLVGYGPFQLEKHDQCYLPTSQ